MDNSKYLYSSIFLIGLFLLFIPQICSADIAVGFLSYNPPLLVIVIFMGVWIIEALTIKDKLVGTPQKALFTGLIINLFTALLGFLIALSVKNSVIEDVLSYGFIPSILIFLFVSIIIETMILYFYYRQEKWPKIIATGFLMNAKSYLFLLIFLILDAMVIGAFLVLIIVPYFFLKTFELLSAGKEISKSNRTKAIILITILSLIVCGFVFKGVMKGMEKSSFEKRGRAKEARIMADMNQIRSSAEVISDNEGSYVSFTCTYNDTMNTICNDVEKQAGMKPTIYTTFDKYCSHIKLLRGERWFCIDSRGNNYVTNVNPSTLGYCDGKTFICPPRAE